MEVREPPWGQDELPPMVNIMRVALAKSRSVMGASHQQAFMGSWLTIGQVWQPCLPSSRWVKALCSIATHDWANGGSVDVFLTW